tara:strand:+ start:2133 stop:3185 length:1053 start_codon:yes stop_codon:yes gene_type:complete
MKKIFYLILISSIKNVYSSCSCALGYRNGAASTDTNLCMGPSEGGKRPCYPMPCNADWTPCTNQDAETLWVKDSTHTGKRPDCPFVKINSNGDNYNWAKLDKCKEKCIDEPTGKCNMVSRYGDTVKSSTEYYHCRFYACPDPDNFVWITQTQWGNYATSCNTYKLPVRHYILNENIVNKIRYNNVTRWVNKTRYKNVTRYNDVTRYTDKTRWKNKTRYNNVTRYVKKYVNKTRWVNKSKCTKPNIENPDVIMSDDTKTLEQNKSESKLEVNETECSNFRLRDIYFVIIIVIFLIIMITREVYRKKIEKHIYCNTEVRDSIFEIPRIRQENFIIRDPGYAREVTVEAVPVK